MNISIDVGLIIRDISSADLGVCLAKATDIDQAAFFEGMARSMMSWNAHEREMQALMMAKSMPPLAVEMLERILLYCRDESAKPKDEQ